MAACLKEPGLYIKVSTPAAAICSLCMIGEKMDLSDVPPSILLFFDEKRINLGLLNKLKNTIKTILTKGESTAQSFQGEGKREGRRKGEGLGFIVLSVLDLRRNSRVILLYRKNRKEFATGSMPTMTI